MIASTCGSGAVTLVQGTPAVHSRLPASASCCVEAVGKPTGMEGACPSGRDAGCAVALLVSRCLVSSRPSIRKL